ncbi:MAG: hypothetical protein HYZ38_22005 [Mycobacterium sp.]|nr:hypothetical protein [Mycobacterium sp.]
MIAAAKRALLAMERLGAKADWLLWYTSITNRNSKAVVASWVEQATRGERSRQVLRVAGIAQEVGMRNDDSQPTFDFPATVEAPQSDEAKQAAEVLFQEEFEPQWAERSPRRWEASLGRRHDDQHKAGMG